MNVKLILSVCNDLAIGNGANSLCVHSKSDLNHFKRMTTGHIVVMGRKTFESLPNGPLPNRLNCVISSIPLDVPNVWSASSLELMLEVISEEAPTDQDVWIIGGKRLFEEAIEFANDVYLTRFEFDCGPNAIKLSQEFNDKLQTQFECSLLAISAPDEPIIAAYYHYVECVDKHPVT